jgi:mRNA interferase MazF
VRRGDVWWVTFPAPVGRRPAVLVSRAQAYRVRTAVTVVPLSRTIRRIATEVELGPADGVPKRSAANADNITTVPMERLDAYLATLAQPKVRALDEAIRFALELK